MPSDDPTKPMHPADVFKFEPEEKAKKGSIIIYFEDETRVFDLFSPQTSILIGRGSDMDVIIDDESLSRQHARFIYSSDKGLNVIDLGSRNGTMVDGRTLRENDSASLSSGDEVLMGDVRAVVALMGERSRVKPPAKFTMRRIPGAENLVVLNPAMKAVYQQVVKVVDHDSPVLITGETGTGKEHVAAALHAAGPRSKKPFISVNCGAIPADLVESIFFGHEKGAFTSATTSRVGAFEKASGGVLFLDEVGELPWESQASLLRAVETGRITRIGSNREIQVDVRVVSATNCDLEQMVADKRFRKDLLYRLNTVTFELAPLRNRRDEIKPLAELFLARFCKSYKRPRKTIDPAAVELLESNDWPGNIRQLKSTIERCALLAPGNSITADLLPAALDDTRVVANALPPIRQKDESDLSFQQRLKQWEKRTIRDALRRTEGNRSEAARILRMPRRTFARKLNAYGFTSKKRESG